MRKVLTTPRLLTISANGMDLAVWEWPGAGPPLLFAHATGFHGRCWDQIARAFPACRRLALEFRGHGRSAKPSPPYHWDAFGCDLAAIARGLNLQRAIAIGHSMGGHSVVSAATLRPESFAALLLLDPTIFPPEIYGGPPKNVDFIRRRRNTWKSPDEMFERFRGRAPFASWDPQVLRDYCDFGLLPRGDEFVLACPPDVEASIYEHSNATEANLHVSIPSIAQPVVILRSGTPWNRETFRPESSPTDPDLGRRFQIGRDVLLEDSSHFIPMECPEIVVAEIEKLTAQTQG